MVSILVLLHHLGELTHLRYLFKSSRSMSSISLKNRLVGDRKIDAKRLRIFFSNFSF